MSWSLPAAIMLMLIGLVSRAWSDESVTFKAHGDNPVRRVAFSPDGKKLLTAGNGKHSLKLWDAATQKLVREFASKGSGIIAADFTPNGKRVFATSWDRRVRIWNAATGKLERTILAAGMPHGAAYSPTQSRMALAFLGGITVQIADVKTGKTVKTLKIPMEKPPEGGNSHAQVCYSPDGKWLVAVCGGRGWPKFIGGASVMTIWDTRTWVMRARFTADSHHVNRLAISRDGKLIAGSCCGSKTVKLWNVPNPDPKKAVAAATIEQHIKQLDEDRFAAREKAQQRLLELGPLAAEAVFKAAASESPEVRLRATSLLEALEVPPSHVFQGGAASVHAMTLSLDGAAVAWGCRSKHVYYCRVQGMPKPIVMRTASETWSVAFSPDGEKLAIGDADGAVTLRPVPLRVVSMSK